MPAKSGHFTIELDDQPRIVRVVASGHFEKHDGERMITAARTAAAQRGWAVLYDVREVTTTIPLEEWFHLPRELPVLTQKPTRGVRVAILMAPGIQEDFYRFYELVSGNVGLTVHVTDNEAEALRWLAPND